MRSENTKIVEEGIKKNWGGKVRKLRVNIKIVVEGIKKLRENIKIVEEGIQEWGAKILKLWRKE